VYLHFHSLKPPAVTWISSVSPFQSHCPSAAPSPPHLFEASASLTPSLRGRQNYPSFLGLGPFIDPTRTTYWRSWVAGSHSLKTTFMLATTAPPGNRSADQAAGRRMSGSSRQGRCGTQDLDFPQSPSGTLLPLWCPVAGHMPPSPHCAHSGQSSGTSACFLFFFFSFSSNALYLSLYLFV
jgi:hypothetical protein